MKKLFIEEPIFWRVSNLYEITYCKIYHYCPVTLLDFNDNYSYWKVYPLENRKCKSLTTIMSDQENEIEEPLRRKRSCPSIPFQPLSLPVHGNDEQTQPEPSKKIKMSRSQDSYLVSDSGDKSQSFSKSSAGVIKKVKLVNFMCHSHFEIQLNPRINFVSGCNGSGKSAIQTAIVIALGGTASKTNRSSKVDGLVKHGCNAASVTITLSNTGLNAYKPEIYGNEIQVVRTINSGSSYKIYNHCGRLISNKKAELENILQKLRIQPNNPVAILNQDMARNFLAANKAENKYALFRKATLLDEAEQELAVTVNNIAEQQTLIESKQKAVQQIEEDIAKMTKKIQLSNKLKQFKEEKFELENELLWSQLNTKRNDLTKLKEICSQQINLKKDLEKEVNERRVEMEKHKSKKEQLDHDLGNLLHETKNKEELKRKLSDEYRALKKSYDTKTLKLDEIEAKIRSKNSDLSNLKISLDDVERNEVELKQKKEEAKMQKKQNEEVLKNLESELTVLENELTRLRDTAEQYSVQIRHKKEIIEDNRRQIGTMQSQTENLSKSDNLSKYGQWMPTLKQRIESAVKANKFSKPPLGPIGSYLEVKDAKWIYAIENNLGFSFLSSFFVDNVRDRKVLYDIMNEVCGNHKPAVHTSRFQESARGESLRNTETTAPGYNNMFRTLTIKNNIVANFLIDFRNIQKILLVEKKENCRHFVSRDENIPRECHLILDLDADQYLPGFRVYANQDRSRLTRVLQKSVGDHQKKLKEEIENKRRLMEEIQGQKETLERQFANIRPKINEISSAITKVNTQKAEVRRKAHTLQAILDTESPSLRAQLEELEDIEKEIAKLKVVKEEIVAEKENEHEKLLDLHNRVKVLRSDDTFSQQASLTHEKEEIEQHIRQLATKLDTYEKKITDQEMKITNLTNRINETKKNLETEQNTLSQFSGQVEPVTNRSSGEIQAELERVKAFIEEAKNKLGTNEIDFEKQYWDKKNSHKQFVNTFNELKKLHNKLKNMRKERVELITKIRDLNANVITIQFQTVLESRSYKGRLVFDHQARKLDILLAPTDGSGSLMNTESLSGGEKSFSTVAFLMALWSNMELPFYSMDEYDVFMDAINRKAITKLLMSFAVEKSSHQFIFLTPLDVSIIDTGPHVHVHRIRKLQ